jgi:hypothetical protein
MMPPNSRSGKYSDEVGSNSLWFRCPEITVLTRLFCIQFSKTFLNLGRRAIELNNGRAAQMGILALMVHEKLGVNIIPGV